MGHDDRNDRARKKFRLLTPADLDALPDPTWLIDRIIPAGAFCVLYGEPGSGKSFVALSMALSIAAGHQWCGKITGPGSVLYFVAEGVIGFKYRARAYRRKHSIVPAHIRYLGEAFDLLKDNDVQEILAILRAEPFQPNLIILDTLARLIPGADENSAKDMGRAIAAIDRLRGETNASVLVIHHTVKNGKSERGSGALRGAADVMIECSGDSDPQLISLKCDKMKDAEPFPNALVGLERIVLSPSQSSLAVADWKDALEAGAANLDADAALQILQDVFGGEGATHGKWKAEYSAKIKSPSTFDRALRILKARGAVRKDGAKYRPANMDGQCQVSPGVKAVS